MTATYELSTQIGKIRLLIPDTDISSPLFSDEELATLLDISGGENIFRAAALAISNTAGSTSLSNALAVRLADGTSISDGSNSNEALLKRAEWLYKQADMYDAQQEDGAFVIAEINSTHFATRRIIENEWLRGV